LPDNHIAGVDADTQLELPVEQLRKPTLHRERSVQCPLGVIFERTRCAECSHHGVARELFDRPAGALDFLGHRVVETLEQSSRALRILGTGERRRADQVGEHHGRQLSLAGRPLVRDRCTAGRAEARLTRDLRSATVTNSHAPIVAHKQQVGRLAAVHARF